MLVRYGSIQGDDVAGSTILAVLAHAVAQPPFAAGAHAASVVLFALTDARAPAVILLELLKGDLEPSPGLFVVDLVLSARVVMGCHDESPPSAFAEMESSIDMRT